jgi:hypothetical protein
MEQDRKQADAARVLTTDEITKMLGAERTDTTPDAKPPVVTLLTRPKSA